MLQTIPTITLGCMIAQDKIAKRLPPHLYVDDMLGILKDENPVIYEWILAFGRKIDRNVEDVSDKAWIKFTMLANVGIFYSAIKAQIEGNALDDECGLDVDAEPDGKAENNHKRLPGGSNDDERRKK